MLSELWMVDYMTIVLQHREDFITTCNYIVYGRINQSISMRMKTIVRKVC
jgi:hypothetical protein